MVKDKLEEDIFLSELLFMIFVVLSCTLGLAYSLETNVMTLVFFILSVGFMIACLLTACYKSIMKKLEEIK